MTQAQTITTALSMQSASYQVGKLQILHDVSLDLHYGQVLALVGPNGAGKSTALGLFAGGIPPTRGAVYLDDQPLEVWVLKTWPKYARYFCKPTRSRSPLPLKM